MNKTSLTMLATCALLMASAVTADEPAASSADKAAFTQLKSLAGTWEGKDADAPAGAVTRMTFEVASAGNAVIERLMPGTPGEMITVYYLASGKLRATHYCAAGNQPAFALASSKDGVLTFAFAGGTGFDPAKDAHVHEGYLKLVAPDQLESRWAFHQGGKEQGAHRWLLKKL